MLARCVHLHTLSTRLFSVSRMRVFCTRECKEDNSACENVTELEFGDQFVSVKKRLNLPVRSRHPLSQRHGKHGTRESRVPSTQSERMQKRRARWYATGRGQSRARARACVCVFFYQESGRSPHGAPSSRGASRGRRGRQRRRRWRRGRPCARRQRRRLLVQSWRRTWLRRSSGRERERLKKRRNETRERLPLFFSSRFRRRRGARAREADSGAPHLGARALLFSLSPSPPRATY